jgi:hypothetical protein
MKTSARLFSLLVVPALLSACATVAKVDESYTAQDPAFTRSFAKSPKSCIAATTLALKDLGAAVESQKDGTIVSERYSVFDYAESSGSAYYAKTSLNRQMGKLYLKVSGGDAGCVVRVLRVRAWENNAEFDAINVDFTKSNVTGPFFKNLEERLRG